MNCEGKNTGLNSGNCEESKKSAVSKEISREAKVNINIKQADIVTVGSNNVIIYDEGSSHDHNYERKQGLSNGGVSDESGSNPYSHSTSGERTEEEKFSMNSLPALEGKREDFVSDKEENGVENASRNFSRSPKRNRKRKEIRKKHLSCSLLKFTSEDRLESETNVQATIVQVVFPKNDGSGSDGEGKDKCQTLTRERDEYSINIDAKSVQIGRDNYFLSNQKINWGPSKTKTRHYLNKRQRPQNRTRRKGENAKFTKRQKLDCIMKELHKYRDNGQWEEFEIMTSEILNENAGNTDIRIHVLLEKSVAVNYQKNLKQAQNLAQEALSLAPRASQPMVDVFLGRAHCCLVCVHKRTNEFEKAFENIKHSEEYLAKTDSVLDKAFLAYEKGCVLLASAPYDDPPDSPRRENQLNEAEECFEQCLKLCWQMYRKGEKMYLNKHLFAMMKKVMLMLDCHTKNGRSRQVSSKKVEKAKTYLDKIQDNQDLWERVADFPIARVQFELAQADYFFRKKNYRKAEEHAQTAASLAIDAGFNTEIEPANERLTDIQERWAYEAQNLKTLVIDSEPVETWSTHE